VTRPPPPAGSGSGAPGPRRPWRPPRQPTWPLAGSTHRDSTRAPPLYLTVIASSQQKPQLFHNSVADAQTFSLSAEMGRSDNIQRLLKGQ
jgi:hypothetical protein